MIHEHELLLCRAVRSIFYRCTNDSNSKSTLMVLFRYYGYFLSCPNFVIDPLHFEKGTNTRRGRIFGSLKRANISGPIHKQGA